MARYRKVEVAVWTDRRFLAMSTPAQRLWLYLLTGPRTTVFPGLVVAREAVIADDLRWPIDTLREAFAEAFSEGLVEASWKAGLVVLRKALFDSSGRPRGTAKPESPNVLRGWARAWDEIPDCALKFEYLRRLGSFAEALGETFTEAFSEAFAKGLAQASLNQDQDQDQDQDQEQDLGEPPKPPKGGELDSEFLAIGTKPDSPGLTELKRRVGRARKLKPSHPTPDEREIAGRVLGKLTEVTGIAYRSDAHTAFVVARLREGITEFELRAVIAYCASPKSAGGLGWEHDEHMRTFLRPSTMFGPVKIHEYLDAARTWGRADIELAKRDAERAPLKLVPEAT